MLIFFVNILISTLAILITARLLPGFEIDNPSPAIISCLMVGLINFLIRPILLLLAIPLNMATIGLFTFIFNALILNLATGLIDDFNLTSWGASLLGAFILTLFRLSIDSFPETRRKLLG